MTDQEKKGIQDAVLLAITQQHPDASTRDMYGGQVIEMRAGDPKSSIGGLLSYAAHVSLELTKGALLDDPDKLLEGKGKQRRHLKLFQLEDIEAKRCLDFVRAAVSLEYN